MTYLMWVLRDLNESMCIKCLEGKPDDSRAPHNCNPSHRRGHRVNSLRQMHQPPRTIRAGAFSSSCSEAESMYLFLTWFLNFSNLEICTNRSTEKQKENKITDNYNPQKYHGKIDAFFFQTSPMHIYLHSRNYTVYIIQYVAVGHLTLEHMHFPISTVFEGLYFNDCIKYYM